MFSFFPVSLLSLTFILYLILSSFFLFLLSYMFPSITVSFYLPRILLDLFALKCRLFFILSAQLSVFSLMYSPCFHPSLTCLSTPSPTLYFPSPYSSLFMPCLFTRCPCLPQPFDVFETPSAPPVYRHCPLFIYFGHICLFFYILVYVILPPICLSFPAFWVAIFSALCFLFPGSFFIFLSFICMYFIVWFISLPPVSYFIFYCQPCISSLAFLFSFLFMCPSHSSFCFCYTFPPSSLFSLTLSPPNYSLPPHVHKTRRSKFWVKDESKEERRFGGGRESGRERREIIEG